ncbi:hypothetical protein LZ32DRAFT_460086 [Colletotrichum eremochloae]|nr:hypothetical protein LZ32DRAFT_460086 [Colletotrichum eremochloae]
MQHPQRTNSISSHSPQFASPHRDKTTTSKAGPSPISISRAKKQVETKTSRPAPSSVSTRSRPSIPVPVQVPAPVPLRRRISKHTSKSQHSPSQSFAPATLATLVFLHLIATHLLLGYCSVQPSVLSSPSPPVFKTQSASHISTDPLLPPSSLLPNPSSKLQTAISAHLAIPLVGTHPLSSKSKREEKSTRSARHINDRLLPPFPSPLFF